MAGFQISGKVLKVGKTEQVSEKFKKREIVIEDRSNEQYPEVCVFQFVQDKCGNLDQYRAGDVVTIDFNIKGRAFQKPGEETKYFSNLQGWKISGTGSAGNNSSTGGSYTAANAPDLDGDEPPF